MSKKSIKEYIAEKKRSYAASSRERKHRVLNEICETTGLSRKYITNILNGKIRYHARSGRGKVYKGDTFALGGGDPSDNFFWILDVTDRLTQWTELQPTWNRRQHTTCEALKRTDRRFPFLDIPHFFAGHFDDAPVK